MFSASSKRSFIKLTEERHQIIPWRKSGKFFSFFREIPGGNTVFNTIEDNNVTFPINHFSQWLPTYAVAAVYIKKPLKSYTINFIFCVNIFFYFSYLPENTWLP